MNLIETKKKNSQFFQTYQEWFERTRNKEIKMMSQVKASKIKCSRCKSSMTELTHHSEDGGLNEIHCDNLEC